MVIHKIVILTLYKSTNALMTFLYTFLFAKNLARRPVIVCSGTHGEVLKICSADTMVSVYVKLTTLSFANSNFVHCRYAITPV
jgi:hypothetical protein